MAAVPVSPRAVARRMAAAAPLRVVLLLGSVLATATCGDDSPGNPSQIPVKLGFIVQPAVSTAGDPIAPVVEVAVETAKGKTVTSTPASITIAIVSGTGTAGAVLGGTLTRTTVNGVARFADLTIDKAGSGYALSATATGLDGATSDPFVVDAGLPIGLAFTVEPGLSEAGVAVAPGVQVAIVDALDNTVTGSSATVTLAITSGSGVAGALLGGTVSRAVVGGVATFDDLTIDKAGAGYTFTATSAGLPAAVSTDFTVAPGAAAQLVFAPMPVPLIAGALSSPSISVALVDVFGNAATTSSAIITLAVATGPGALQGPVSRSTSSGVARFPGLAIDQPGTGYTLTASAVGYPSVTSASFDVTAWDRVSGAILLQSETGDYIGDGKTYEYSQADAILRITVSGGHLTLILDGDENWRGEFQEPSQLTQLQAGSYTGLTRYPFHDPAVGGLSWSGEGRGCNMLSGSFTIHEATYSSGALTSILLRFVQVCENFMPPLYGMVRWSANDPLTPPGPVTPIPGTLWKPAPGSTPASGAYVYLESQPGDWVGQGQTLTYTPADATITVTESAGLLRVTVGQFEWDGFFKVMSSLSDLQPGYYPDLQRHPFHNPAKGGLSWSGQARGCNTLTGWFAIDNVVYLNGTLAGIDLRFEQVCEGFMPPLHGEIHW